jgi:hypothetical protein
MKVVLCILFALAAFVSGKKEITLQYSFKPGDQYEWTQSTKQTIKQTLPGMGDLTMEVKADGAFKLKVLQLTATGARIEAQYVKIKVESNSPMVNMNFDSGGDGDDIQSKMVRSMIGRPFYLYLTNQGVIEKVEGVDVLFSGINELGLDDAAKARVKKLLEETVGGTSIKSSLEAGFLAYPANKIKAGDTWKSSGALPLNFPIAIANQWTLQQMDGSSVTLQAAGDVSTVDREKVTTLPNGMKSKVDLAGLQTVIGKVNLKTGWPTQVKVTSDIAGKMVLVAGGMLPSDMEIPMTIRTESDFIITKK